MSKVMVGIYHNFCILNQNIILFSSKSVNECFVDRKERITVSLARSIEMKVFCSHEKSLNECFWTKI